MKILKKVITLLLILFIAAQLFRPEKNDGDLVSIETFFNDTNTPKTIKTIFKESCFDCHSSTTRYPWYSKITPINYWMAGHIKHGKGHLDFSKWNDYSIEKKDHKLEEIIETMETHIMPLSSYKWLHNDANLSKIQIDSIINWANQVRFKYSLEQKPQ